MKVAAPRRELGRYPLQVEILTRYSDVDPQEHINNVAVAEYYQESRLGFHRGLAAADQAAGSRTLVARHEMDYLAEISYPGRVIVGIGVAHIGRTSYTLEAAMFQDGRCVGVASTVLVHADERGPAAIPPALRAYLQKHLTPDAPPAE